MRFLSGSDGWAAIGSLTFYLRCSPLFMFLFTAVLLWGFMALIVTSSCVTPWAHAKPSRRRDCKGVWRGRCTFSVICMVIVVVARTASATRCDSVIPGLAVDTTRISFTCDEGAMIACRSKIGRELTAGWGSAQWVLVFHIDSTCDFSDAQERFDSVTHSHVGTDISYLQECDALPGLLFYFNFALD